MAETKQGGFHAFEKRVHEIEEADREAERKGQAGPAAPTRMATPEERGAKREMPKK
jgi:hypothetical protein